MSCTNSGVTCTNPAMRSPVAASHGPSHIPAPLWRAGTLLDDCNLCKVASRSLHIFRMSASTRAGSAEVPALLVTRSSSGAAPSPSAVLSTETRKSSPASPVERRSRMGVCPATEAVPSDLTESPVVLRRSGYSGARTVSAGKRCTRRTQTSSLLAPLPRNTST